MSLGLLAMVAHCCQAAESLPDPTRPPDAFGVGGESDAAPPPVPVLQSVLLSATRKMAIISGQAVPLGEKFGAARLIRLTSSEAVLRTGDTLQVLKLFPDVEKVEKVEKKERLVPQDENKGGKKTSRPAPKKKAKQ